VYSLGSNRPESERLQRQAEELEPDSRALLDRVGLSPGQSAIDFGCGPRGVLDLLAAGTSPGGRVVGLDADPAHTRMAADFAAHHDLDSVEVVTADARRCGLPSDSFDVVHARTLLVTLPNPHEPLDEMVRLAQPGGWVASMEPDTERTFCYPPSAEFERVCTLFPMVFARNGADPHMGRRVPELLRNAGLVDVGYEVRVQCYPPGHSRRTVTVDLLKSMRPHLLDLGLSSEDELDEIDRASRAHISDPRTVVVSGLLFLSWGRKPS
jgi:SAM-dependent methyltransferase